MLELLDTNFAKLTNDEVINRVVAIANLLSVHPVFKDPFPEVVPDPERLREMAASLRDRVNAAARGDRDRIAERNQAREEIITSVTMTAQYLVMVANFRKEPSILDHTGFRIKSRTTYSKVSGAPTINPQIYGIKRGHDEGSVVVMAKRHPGRVSYIIEMCKGDPAEGLWNHLGHFLQCKTEVKGLEPASKVNFRVRYDINGNLSDWSPPAGIIVT